MAGRNGATEEQVVQGRADLFHLINDVGRALRGGTREEPRVDPMAESVMTPELIRTPAFGKAESSIGLLSNLVYGPQAASLSD